MVTEASQSPEPVSGLLARLLRRIPVSGGLRGLRHRTYFVLWSTLLVTQVGFWVSNVSMQWLVARLSDNNSFQLGLLYFCNLVPILLFAPYAGVIADRYNRQRIVTLTQALTGLCALGLVIALTLIQGDGSLAIILCFAFAIGTAIAMNAPANQALMVNSVPHADVPSAVGLQSVGLNMSRVAGPAVATPLLATWGARPCFAIFAITSLFSSLVVSRVRVRAIRVRPGSGSAMERIREGLRIARQRPPALLALAMVAVTAVFASSYVSQLPYFAYEVLDGGDRAFMTIVILTGIGAAAGALRTSSSQRLASLRDVGIQMILMGGAIAVLAVSRFAPLTYGIAAVIAFFNFSVMTNLQTTLQYVAPEHGRGRIMSLFIVAWGGLLPLGTLAIGALGSLWGTPLVIVCSTAVAVSFGLGVALRGPRMAPEMPEDEDWELGEGEVPA